ncbi:MAG: hypothetical protein ACHQUC_03865 [Chlamydiales bacterium]
MTTREFSAVFEFSQSSLNALERNRILGSEILGISDIFEITLELLNDIFREVDAILQGCKIRVTTLERTFVDVLDRPTLISNWEEIWRSLESIEYLNLQQVLAYAQILNNVTTYARIAFFLDQHREMLGLSEKDLLTFDSFKPKSPHYLDRHSKEPKQFIARWYLIVPKSLLQRTWEEPHRLMVVENQST